MAAGSAVFVFTLGLVRLAGWLFHSFAVIQLLTYLPPMTRNAAACFVLSGLALFLLALGRARWLVLVCAGLSSSVGLLTVVEFVFGVNAGIDEILGPSYITMKM